MRAICGGSPLPLLRDLEPAAYEQLLRTNVIAPQQLIRALVPSLPPQTVIINISSDAGVDHYETWGGYGSSKAALDHQTLTWAAEEPDFTWYSLDPWRLCGRAMHQAAFPGEDISDRPEPESIAPIVVALINSGLPSAVTVPPIRPRRCARRRVVVSTSWLRGHTPSFSSLRTIPAIEPPELRGLRRGQRDGS
jgi:NAD(P)-dependent dehydrogenase (short-subunit alcohol dehydrogenase family)